MKPALIISAFILLGGIGTSVVIAQTIHTAPVIPITSQVVIAPEQPPKPDLNELAILVNKDRTDVGLPPLTRDPDLDASATDKCNDMVVGKYWGHVNAAGMHGYEYIDKYMKSKYRSENLLKGVEYNSVIANKSWMGSTPHRTAILNDTYDKVGYATCSVEGSGIVTVQHFVDL